MIMGNSVHSVRSLLQFAIALRVPIFIVRIATILFIRMQNVVIMTDS